MSVRVRFAPSPTGALHIGGVRTALFNYLFAKKNNGKFILRLEDTDRSRFVKGAEEYIVNALNWAGLTPDESPAAPGGFGPYRQSERKTLYKEELEKLILSGKAYYAFDTPEELAAARSESEQKGEVFKYSAHNRAAFRNAISLSKEELKNEINKGNGVVRLKVAVGETIVVKDEIRGVIRINSDEIDDKVLMKADGMPTYHFANIVDDHHMQITHVIRGEEWLPSLPLHKIIYEAFDWEVPVFMHLPLILKPEGKGKLSKRDGDKAGFPVFPLEWENNPGFRERGFLPEAMINYLSLLGWNPGSEQEIFSLDELVNAFEIDKIQKGGARFDFNKAKWVNHKYLENLETKSILKRFPEFFQALPSTWSEKKRTLILGAVKERLNLLEEFEINFRLFFEDPKTYDEKVLEKIKKKNPEKIIDFVIELCEKEIDALEWKSLISKWNEEHQYSFGIIMQSLRLAIVGNLSGPDLFLICSLLGKDVTLGRLKKFKPNL
ncbi:glutamate--tRNA ligase [Flavobacteriaceae bacterium]|nr:glutamate--tRNA ligase [Flavobacteriaceae bacterium]